MNAPLRIAIAQFNPLVGDIEGNVARMVERTASAREQQAQLVLFPELVLTGYPPEDLLLRPGLHPRLDAALAELCRHSQAITLLVGYPERVGERLFNTCAVIRDGGIPQRYHKHTLPNYGVFDEKRYFQAGEQACVFEVAGIPCGITICEDIWSPEPARLAARAGAKILLNINASPFQLGKSHQRERIVAQRVADTGLPIVYANLVGGQDELVFDGASFTMDRQAEVAFQAPAFEEGLYRIDIDPASGSRVPPSTSLIRLTEDEATYRALVTGVRDYVAKNGFKGAVIGLSGGIDSALTLAIAVDALGADAVEAVLMPSRYTANMSLEDALAEVELLGVHHHIIPIEQPFKAFLDVLADTFAGAGVDATEENIQARCRGIILMAISNKQGRIVLTTGNKSEMAVGYATLYGDMAGGFAPLKDVPKMLVYRLSNWRNQQSPVIPQRVIDRPPSAELAPDQKDSDSLPAYEILDAILERYVEQDLCPEDIIAEGFAEADVQRVVHLVNRNEYKRRQAAPGIKITRRAFGRERRYPITSGFDGGSPS